MADEGLVRYIKERLGEGYKEQHIREVLLQHGHDEPAIAQAFAEIHRLRSPRLLPFLVLLLFAGALIIYLVLRPAPEPVAPPPEVEEPPSPPTADAVTLAESLLLESAEQTPDETYYSTVKASDGVTTVADGILICSVNRDPLYKSYCLQSLAKERTEAEYCVVIADAKQRDDCYVSIILQGEDQYCSALVLEESKRLCELL